MFVMLIQDEVERNKFSNWEYGSQLMMLSAAAMVFTQLVLLNLLIAIMGKSYERILEKEDVEFLMLRAKLILEFEDLLSEGELLQLEAQGYFPRTLQLLVPAGDPHMLGKEEDTEVGAVMEEVQGLKEMLKREVEEVQGLRKAQEVMGGVMKEEMKEIKEAAKQADVITQQRLQQMEATLGNIESTLYLFQRHFGMTTPAVAPSVEEEKMEVGPRRAKRKWLRTILWYVCVCNYVVCCFYNSIPGDTKTSGVSAITGASLSRSAAACGPSTCRCPSHQH
jgi:hypothetical protein